MGGSLLTAAIDAAAQAGSDAGDLAYAEGSNVHGAIVAAMAELVHHLAEAGCLVEPKPPAPQMTVEDAARLLCELSCSPRLSDPDDYLSLLTSDAMVTYAWRQATGAGIPPTQMSDAHQARRLLMEHHRRAARG